MDINLVMFKGDGTRRDFPVVKPRTVIGRTNSCDLRIPVPDVSRKHCELVLEDDELVLRDLESSNGTFCNDKRVQEIELEPGDNVMVGPVKFVVQIDGEPAEVTPVPTVLGAEGRDVEVDDAMATQDVAADEGISDDDVDVDADPGAPTVVPLVDDDDDEAPIDLLEDIDDLDEPIELADDDPVAALEAMGDEVDPDDSGSPQLADDERPRDGG